MTAMTVQNNKNGGSVDRALRWIGDLDHPHYSDERNRFVWYEASAIGFQMLFLGSYFMAGALLLIFGKAALLYVLAMFVPTMITAMVFQGYLKRHAAEYWPGKYDMMRRRGQIGVLAGIVLFAGIIRATIDLNSNAAGGFWSGTSMGILGAVILGGLGGVAGVLFEKRKADRAAQLDEF